MKDNDYLGNAMFPMRVGKCRVSGSARQGATMLNPGQAPARARSLGESQITVCARKGATKAWLERVQGMFSSALRAQALEWHVP